MGNSNRMLEKGLNRREFLMGLAATGTLLSLGQTDLLKAESRVTVNVFSKHFQWLDHNGMAEAIAEVGFDGVDLTVRRGGHVLPERVEEDLPKVAEACKKAGIKISLMTTDITDPNDPITEKVLRTASKLGIGHYRFGYWYYDEKRDIVEQLKEIKVKMSGMAELNKKYKIFGGNQNHSGTRYFGNVVWDTWEIVKDLDANYIGCQYDSQNALNEGIGGSWVNSARLTAPYTKTFVVKTQAEWGDPEWKKINRKEQRDFRFITYEEFKWYFSLMEKAGFSGPITTHYEFSGLGGADSGRKELKGITRKELFAVFQRNLKILRGMLSETNIL